MKIVHVITRLLRAGAEENTIFTCNLQVARGHDVTILHGRDVHPDILTLIDPRVALVKDVDLVRNVDPVRDFRTVRTQRRIFRDLKPDVVHTHTSKAGITGRAAARLARVPIILHGVHILPFLNVSRAQTLLYKALERAVAPFTDAYIAVSEGMAAANLAAGLGTDDSNHVVASGMDIEKFRAAAPTPERPEGKLLVMVASLEPRKRHLAFLEVFAKILEEAPDTTLACLGEGAERDAILERARALGIDDKVLLLGFRDDVANWVAAADVCVLASEREGLPRVVVQYVATGRPVVVTDLPGIDAIVQDGLNGAVTPMEDLSAMAAPILRILTDQDHAAALAEGARGWDVSAWSREAMETSIEKIMMDVARTKGVGLLPTAPQGG